MDGTLLHTNGKLTKASYEIIQPLIDKELHFVAATGRTRDNALGALSPLNLNLPMICDNGTLIYDTTRHEFISKKNINASEARRIIALAQKQNISPFINTLESNAITVYYSDFASSAQKIYYNRNLSYGLSGYIYDPTYKKYEKQSVYNISILDKYEKLIGLYEHFKDNKNLTALLFPTHYYPGYYWLEFLPADSGKGAAIDTLVEMYHPKKIVCFGDNLNDMCMFERADIKVAPSNAVDEIKEAADVIIGHCDQDSVALYIKDNLCSF